MVRGVGDMGAKLGQLAAAQAGRAAVLARRASMDGGGRAPPTTREVGIGRQALADPLCEADVAEHAAPAGAPAPRGAGVGPDAAQLRRLGEEAALPQVLLPAPCAALPDRAQLARMVAHVEFLRAGPNTCGGADGVQPADRPADGHAPPPAATRPQRAAAPLAHRGQALDVWLGRAFGAADLPRLRRLLAPSPRTDRALVALLRPPEAAADAGDRAAPEHGRSLPVQAHPSERPARATALRFSLRGPRPPAAASVVAASSGPAANEPTGAVPARMNWTAFAALLSQRQMRSLFDAALLRLRDVQAQNKAESSANAVERERTRLAAAHERLVAVAQWLGDALGVQADWRTGKTSVLRNATKPLVRGSSNLVQGDGLEAAEVRARMLAAQRRAAAARPAQLPFAPGAAPPLLDWLPDVDGRPAQRLQRVVLEPEEVAALGLDAQPAWQADEASLRGLEGCDLASVFGRLALSSAQLAQAAARCRDAAVAGGPATGHQGAPDEAAHARDNALRRLADDYAARARAQRERALSCGYLEGALAVGRRQKGEFAETMRDEAQRRRAATEARARLAEALRDPRHEAAPRGQLEARLAQLDVELADRNARLAGMHLAVQMADTLRAARARRRPRGGGLRAAWDSLRPLAPRAQKTAVARVEGQLDALLDPRGVDLCRGGAMQAYLDRLGTEGAAWAETYADPTFTRLDAWARTYSPLMLQFTEPAVQTLARQAERGLDEVAAYFEGDRDAFYAAVAREQAQTEGLVRQLRGLLQVAS